MSTLAWRAANRERINAKKAAWYKANTEKKRAQNAAWCAANPEKVKAYGVAWYKANSGKAKAYGAAWRAANPEKKKAGHRKHKYGITEGAFQDMLFSQNGVCKICRTVFSSEVSPNIDHDHVTGKIRGLLCSSCNSVLGYAKDSVEILEKAKQYLNESRNKKETLDFSIQNCMVSV